MTRGGLDSRMHATVEGVLDHLRDGLVALEPKTVTARVGHVAAIGDGVVRASGLHHAFAGELVDVAGVTAVVESLRRDEVGLVLLGPTDGIEAGAVIRRLGRILEVPAGPELIGRVVDPLGHPLDTRGRLPTGRRVAVEGPPTPLEDREPVGRPLRTGVFAVDTMIPIGRGQRQLVIGDRSTGKTELCLDILANINADRPQLSGTARGTVTDRRSDVPSVVGVYVAIGRRGADTASNLQWLRSTGFFEHGFAVVTDADDPPGLIHLAPYAACAMAEDLALGGRDVVIVYDDLTSHAGIHRTLGLLLGRPVGREAHPSDVFYAHARLLERSTQFAEAVGGGSLTAFPIVETQLGDLTGFIPTNMVSITDGQIRLDASLAAADILPAVDVAMSVSRVGGKAQPVLVRRLAGTFKNRYAQFLELETFARFGTRLEPGAQAVVDWGQRVRRVLRQDRGVSRSWADTVARLLVIGADGFASIPKAELDSTMVRVIQHLRDDSRFDAASIDTQKVGAEAIPDLEAAAAAAVNAVIAPRDDDETHP